MFTRPTRRGFLQTTVAAALAPAALTAAADAPKATAGGPRLKKAVKFDMIKAGSSIQEKFELIKRLGFQGVEIDSPSNVDKDEAVRARDATGVAIHGVIDIMQAGVTYDVLQRAVPIHPTVSELIPTVIGDLKPA